MRKSSDSTSTCQACCFQCKVIERVVCRMRGYRALTRGVARRKMSRASRTRDASYLGRGYGLCTGGRSVHMVLIAVNGSVPLEAFFALVLLVTLGCVIALRLVFERRLVLVHCHINLRGGLLHS